ncbi:MAG: hypothetical protein H0X01_06550 [Nitrospira sp.]|nr:hypothetical protein [Nitrospira sp.]
MEREHVDLGATTPPEESCAQVGSRDYDYLTRARQEARAYIGQLRRMCGEEPDGARLSIKSHPHDFGSYLTVICFFDPDNPVAADYAFRCESKGPQEWDEQAKRDLNSTLERR